MLGTRGEIEGAERERLRTPAQAAVADRERERAVERDEQRPADLLVLHLLQEQEQQGLDPLVLVKAAVAGVPVGRFVADAKRDWADQRRERRRRGHPAGHQGRAWVHAQLQRRHRQEQLRALLQDRGDGRRSSLAVESLLQIAGEVVPERAGRHVRPGQAPTVVVEGRVDDQARAVAPRLTSAEIEQGRVAHQPLAQDLGERAGGQRGVEPAERAELTADERAPEVLTQRRGVPFEEAAVGGRHRAVRRQDAHRARRLVDDVVRRGQAAARDARQIRHTLQGRGAVRRPEPPQSLQPGGPEQRRAAAAALHGDADQQLAFGDGHEAGWSGRRAGQPEHVGRGASHREERDRHPESEARGHAEMLHRAWSRRQGRTGGPRRPGGTGDGEPHS